MPKVNNLNYFVSNDLRNEDYRFRLRQPGLYLDPKVGPVDINTEPRNGTEFILKSKLLEEGMDFINDVITEEKRKTPLQKWAAKEALSFSNLALSLNSNRSMLEKKFPLNVEFPPMSEEKEWCNFLLGSEIYIELFGNENNMNNEKREGHVPYLSTVLHLNQHKLFVLLIYFKKWFNSIGMNNNLCMWIYAVLACIKKPVPTKYEELLEHFYDNCKERMKSCEGEEKARVHLISSLFFNYFCVKAYKIGPSLETFIALRNKNY